MRALSTHSGSLRVAALARNLAEYLHTLAQDPAVAEIERPAAAARPPAPLDQPLQQPRVFGVHRRVLGQTHAPLHVTDEVLPAAVHGPHRQAHHAPFRIAERPDAAEVEQAEPAVGHEEEVAGVQIGVVHAAGEEQPVPGADDQAAEVVAQLLRRVAGQEFLDVNAAQPFHRQHAARRVFLVDARHDDPVVLAEERAGLALEFGLLFIVRFSLKHALQIFELGLEVFPVLRDAERQQEREQVAEVGTDARGDARVLDLDGDLLAGFQASAVDLAEGGGSEGARLECGEDLLRVAAQLVADVLAQQREVHGRRPEVQMLQGIDNLVGDDAGQVGERLSDLHDGAAQVAHAGEEPHGDAQVRLQQGLLVALGGAEPAAQPPGGVGEKDLRLQGAEGAEAVQRPLRHAPPAQPVE